MSAGRHAAHHRTGSQQVGSVSVDLVALDLHGPYILITAARTSQTRMVAIPLAHRDQEAVFDAVCHAILDVYDPPANCSRHATEQTESTTRAATPATSTQQP